MTSNSAFYHRQSIRLKGYDYSQAGMYFVTICCHEMKWHFGSIENQNMILNDFGKIAVNEWLKLSERYPNVLLDVFQIMPNHIHGIIVISVGATLAVAQNAVAQNAVAQNVNDRNANVPNEYAGVNNRAGASPAPTVGNIVGAYKSLVVNKCLEIYKMRNEYMGNLWQRNYWEHIIRNDQSYQYIANYIVNNPENWKNDRFYTE
jgi:REP element-mobilizing transposase RayT